MSAVPFPQPTVRDRRGAWGHRAGRIGALAAAAALSLGLGLGAALAQTAQQQPEGATPAMPQAAVPPVFMELYTAQGCQACPPADAMMVELAARDDVIAVALHVDYWDYIGWPDSFAQSAFSDRQKDYARRHGHTTIYTPQVIVNGTEIVEGFRVMEVMDTLRREAEQRPEVALSLSRDVEAGTLSISATAMDDVAPQVAMASRRIGVPVQGHAAVGTLAMPSAQGESDATAPLPLAAHEPFVIELIRYMPNAQVEILAGENAGRVADYANIVTEWTTVGQWDMMGPLNLTVPVEGDAAIVVVIQERGLGDVVAAARLR